MSDPTLPSVPLWTLERLIAVLIAIATTLVAYQVADGIAAACMLLQGFVANLLIWFPDAIGEISGGAFARITGPTPGAVIRIAGWLLLLSPAALAALG